MKTNIFTKGVRTNIYVGGGVGYEDVEVDEVTDVSKLNILVSKVSMLSEVARTIK